jgi:hypothetical protein
MNKCKSCQKEFEYDKEARKKGYRAEMCNSCSVSEFRRRRKAKAVEYKGGSCNICGYNKCLAALEFHHLEPEHKDFGLAQHGVPRSWEKQKVELDKCILVCSNCHREIHSKDDAIASVLQQ